ncbi:MAG: DUF2635 domain-containing protein [Pseudomonadota bacterium]|nr:DUF2635 domain-containing protein [Pseudomonadota bacterium]
MSEMIRVAPAPGRRVRKPDKQVLAPEGERVLRDHYWDRRLLHGDVVPMADDQASNAVTKGDNK